MKQVIVVLLFLIAGAVLAAPAPLQRKAQKPELNYPTPGRYLIKWGNSTELEGELLSYNQGWFWYYDIKYYFVWEFNRETRMFMTWEKHENYGGHDKMSRLAKCEMQNFNFQFKADAFCTPEDCKTTKFSMKRIR